MNYLNTLFVIISVITTNIVYANDISLCKKGWTFHQQNNYDEAINSFKQCIKLGDLDNENLAQTYRNMGIIHNNNNNSEEAILYYNKGLKLEPNEPWYDYVNIGNAYSSLSKFNQAIESFDLALSLKPDFHEAYYNKGIVYEKMDDFLNAKNFFIKAYQHGPVTPKLMERLNYHNIDLSINSIFPDLSTDTKYENHQPVTTITSVLNEEQTCGTSVLRNLNEHKNSKTIIKSKSYKFNAYNIEFKIPDLKIPETYLRVNLDDRSRGVIDNYLLISNGAFSPVIAAVVVTELPQNINERTKIFKLTKQLEQSLSRNFNNNELVIRKLPNKDGEVLELMVNNRTGSYCFPTSEFVKNSTKIPTIGISRFITQDNILIEFSLIVRKPESIKTENFPEYTRTQMDKFWSGIVLNK